MGEFVELSAADGRRFPAYVAKPVAAPRGAVVVLQEIFGVNSHIRAVADGYAAEGYVAVAPASFDRVRPQVELGYSEQDMQAGMALKAQVEALPAPGVLADIAAAIAEGARLGGGKVGVVGFCWGGLLTWRSACLLDGVAAAVCYYGGGMTSPAESQRQPKAPVLAHFGEQDGVLPMPGVQAFAAAHPNVEVQVYPTAGHGFNCDQRGSYDAPSAALARARTLAFFARHLG